MADVKLAEEGTRGNGNESRIDVTGATEKINRVVQRLDLLLESVFADCADKMGWGGFNLVHFKEHVERSEFSNGNFGKERDDLLSFVANVIWKAWWEAEECYAFVYFDDYSSSGVGCPGILEAVQMRPVCSWNGPDISTMSAWVSDLAAIYEGICAPKAGLGTFSKSAIIGFKVVLEDVRDKFKDIIFELESVENGVAA